MRGRFAAVVSVLGFAGIAHAEPSTPTVPTLAPRIAQADLEAPPAPALHHATSRVEPAQPRGPFVTHYRGSLIAATLGSVALLATPLVIDQVAPNTMSESTAIGMLVAGDLGVFVSGAIVHAAHGEVKRAFGSVAMRGGLALVGAAIASAIPCEDDDEGTAFGGGFCHIGYAGVGAVIGGTAGFVLETIYMTDQTERRGTWAPTVTASSHGASLGFTGAF